MARLILQEGEQTRRFKLNNGKLSIGSGAEATITVETDIFGRPIQKPVGSSDD